MNDYNFGFLILKKKKNTHNTSNYDTVIDSKLKW